MSTARTSPWARHVASLDPVADHATVVRLLSRYEFPWDFQQALSFALFRTFAVPSIGALLHETGEFTRRTQKRYDDTALLLDAMLEHGPARGDGREALRRMNRMHGAYAISADDLRYVLCTFVTMPIRWVDAYGHRALTPAEQLALATSYHELGRHMGIGEPPSTPQEFADHLDAYEAAHFGWSEGGRAVADATLDLFATFPPFGALPGGRALSRAAAYALMDDPLLDALRYPRPSRSVRAAVRGAVRSRGAAVRALPPRSRPKRAQDFASVRGYPRGFDVRTLGTFPPRG